MSNCLSGDVCYRRVVLQILVAGVWIKWCKATAVFLQKPEFQIAGGGEHRNYLKVAAQPALV